jgi:hypothetical protein
MGISSLPLEVLALDAPGFGVFRDAVNSVRGIGLLTGDGSAQWFDRVDSTDFSAAPLKDVPSWIQRYKDVAREVLLLRARAVPGVQYRESWIVVIPRENNRSIAHVYAFDGTRTTYGKNGKYPDYAQNLFEQYQSAAGGDPEGEADASPKTRYGHVGDGTGLISEVRDAWGRTTTYDWDAPTRRLLGVNFVLARPGDNALAARRMRFEYRQIGRWWYVTGITHTAPDGLH